MNAYMPIASVRSSGRPSVKTSGMKKLFHAVIAVNSPTVASIGPDSGSMIRANVWWKFAPSTWAASSSSRSIAMK